MKGFVLAVRPLWRESGPNMQPMLRVATGATLGGEAHQIVLSQWHSTRSSTGYLAVHGASPAQQPPAFVVEQFVDLGQCEIDDNGSWVSANLYKHKQRGHAVVWLSASDKYEGLDSKYTVEGGVLRDGDGAVIGMRKAAAVECSSGVALGGEALEEIDLSQWRSTQSSTGYQGVYRKSQSKRLSFYSNIRINGKQRSLGTFDTAEEAATAYAKRYLAVHSAPPAQQPPAFVAERFVDLGQCEIDDNGSWVSANLYKHKQRGHAVVWLSASDKYEGLDSKYTVMGGVLRDGDGAVIGMRQLQLQHRGHIGTHRTPDTIQHVRSQPPQRPPKRKREHQTRRRALQLT